MLLLTGFPGFIGSQLLPRLLAQEPELVAVCLIQRTHADLARRILKQLDAPGLGLTRRVHLVEADITRAGLALADTTLMPQVTDVWHLAGVYDTVAPRELAERVNVDGTRHLLAVAAELPGLRRFNHVSTCYVSGDFPGEFGEDDLDVGQGFHSVYDETKFAAEVHVRQAIADGLPATVYRPAAVVGDSRTGWTQKFDGPYFVIQFVLRQPRGLAIVPRFTDPSKAYFNIVPIDFLVDALAALSMRDDNVGRTYQLADPAQTSIADIVRAIADATGRRAVWVPLPLQPVKALDRLPGVRGLIQIPAPAFDYLTSTTTYSSGHTQTDLDGAGVTCPRFADYVGRLIAYRQAHPEVTSTAMV